MENEHLAHRSHFCEREDFLGTEEKTAIGVACKTGMEGGRGGGPRNGGGLCTFVPYYANANLA